MRTNTNRTTKRNAILAAAAISTLTAGSVLADGTFTMNVNANKAWETAANWTVVGDTGGQTIPGVGAGAGTEVVRLEDNATGNRVVTIGAAAGWSYSVGEVRIIQSASNGSSRSHSLNATNAGTLTTGLLSLDPFDGTSNGDRVNATTNANLALAGGGVGGLLTIANNSSLNTRQLTINGSITSTGLTLTGSGTGTGDNGRINLNGAVNFGSGIFLVQGTANRVVAGAVAGSGGIQHSGTGTLTLSNAGNTFTGGLTIDGGGTVVASNSQLGAVANGITLSNNGQLNANSTTLDAARVVTVGAGGGRLQNATLAADGQLAGSGALSLNSVTVGGANVGFGGNVTIGGTVTAGNASAFGTAGTIAVGTDASYATTFAVTQADLDRITAGSTGRILLGVDSSGPLNLSATPTLGIGSSVGVAGVTIAGQLTGGTNLTFNGSGVLNVTQGVAGNGIIHTAGTTNLNGNNTFTGNLAVNGGTLTLNGSSATAGTATIGGGVLVLNHANALQNVSAININSGALLLDSSINYAHATSLQRLGGGTVGYLGGRTFNSLAEIGSYTAVGAGTQVLGIGAAGDSGTYQLNFVIADVDVDNDTQLNPVRLAKAGLDSTLDLSGRPANTFTGGTDIRQGTVRITALNQLNYTNGSAASIQIGNGGNLHLSGLTGAAVNNLQLDLSAGALQRGFLQVDSGNTAVVRNLRTLTARGELGVTGGGTVAWITGADFASSNDNTAGLFAAGSGSTIHFNQMPRNDGSSGLTGRLTINGTDVNIRYLNAENSNALYGVNYSGPDNLNFQVFRGFDVSAGASGTVQVDEGKTLKASGRSTGHQWLGTVTKTGAGTFHLGGDASGSAANSGGTGRLNLLAGTVRFGGLPGHTDGQSPFPANIALSMEAGSTLRLDSFQQGAPVRELNVNQAGTGVAFLTNNSAGDFTANGDIRINGTLELNGVASTASIVGLAMSPGASAVIRHADDAVIQVNSTTLLKVNGTAADPFTDTVDGSHLAIVNNGSTITGTNASFAGMTVLGGTATARSLTGTGTTRIDAPATLALAGNAVHTQGSVTNNGVLNVHGGTAAFNALTGTGTTNVGASGTLQVNGGSNTQGAVNVTGILSGTGTIAAPVAVTGGRVAPGTSPGTLTINGSVSFDATSTYAVEIASASSFDQLVVSGNKSLAGNLEIDMLASYSPLPADSFTVMTGAGNVSGAFTNLNAWGLITVLGGGKAFVPQYTSTDVVLTDFARVGDVNRDGAVNNLDIATFVSLLTGSPAAGSVGFAGDVNGDGVVNNLDIAPFVALLTGGRPVGDDPDFQPLLSLVPEPASLSLLALGGLMLGRRRRA